MNTFSITDFEAKHRNLKEVYNDHNGSWETRVFLDIDGRYYAKGPFGHYEAPCYIDLELNNEAELTDWIKKHEAANL